MDKEFLYSESFIKSLTQTSFYRGLPVVKDENCYDLSILLISFKRTHNLFRILTKLSQQTFQGRIELIIWNNNIEESTFLEALKLQFEPSFNGTIILI